MTLRLLLPLVAVSTAVLPAAAQLRVFLAETGASETEPLAGSPELHNPVIHAGETLFIYAQMFAGPEAWNGISLDLEVRGGGTIDSWEFYEYENGPFLRWDLADQGVLEDDDSRVTDLFGLAYETGFGVQNDPAFDDDDGHYLREVDVTLLGQITVMLPEEVDEAEIFLGIGGLGIVKMGTSAPQDVYLGFGDEDDGLTGDSIHQFGSLADATVSACPLLRNGDANCDGLVNSFDIDPFVLALTDAPGYAGQFPDCDPFCTCDINRDGVLNSFDIDPFVDLLSGGMP